MSKNVLSPDVIVYKPSITSLSSIFFRITGILILGLWFFIPFFNNFIFFYILSCQLIYKIISLSIFYLIFYLIVYLFSYHILNGCRHIFWDNGYLYSMNFLAYFFSIVLFLIFSINIIFFLLI